MRVLPEELTRPLESFAGETPLGDGLYLGYWCDECQRYRIWPGPDWGASHYFCDDCLTKLEMETIQ